MPEFTDISAGHLIVKQLEKESVERIYCVPGESYLDVLDGLYDSSIRTVTCRQEGGAGMAAMSEARLTGRAGVAMVTRGPGAGNVMIAVHNSWQDGTPLVLFVGLVPSLERDREAFQDFSLEGWFGTTAKRVFTLDNPTEAARVVRSAFQIAESGKPGPVIIGLPEELLKTRVAGDRIPRPAQPPALPNTAELDSLLQRLHDAEAPTIVLGGEVWSSDAAEAIARIGENLAVPVTTDFRAADMIDNRSASFAGMLGYGRDQRFSNLLDDSDLILFIGIGRADVLSDGYTIGLDAETVVVSPDPELPAHYGRIDTLFNANPAEFVRALDARHDQADLVAPLESRTARLHDAHAAYEEYSTPAPDQSRFADAGELLAAVREFWDPESIVTYGAGNYAVWNQRYLPSQRYPSVVAPKNGAMGLGIPAAVGAALAAPGRKVLSFAGDGCFMMNGQEVATAVAEGLNIVIFVLDNGVFGTIRSHQERDYPGRQSGTHLINPDFAKYANAFGGTGFTLDGSQDMRETVREALSTQGVVIVHAKIDPDVRDPSPQR